MTHAEVIEGTVESVNDRGVRVNGSWFNQSKFKPIELPKRVGERVRLDIDTKGFILDCTVLDDDDKAVEIVLPDKTATRIAVLQAAAHFAAARDEIKSADVLRIASSWLAWVQEPQAQPSVTKT